MELVNEIEELRVMIEAGFWALVGAVWIIIIGFGIVYMVRWAWYKLRGTVLMSDYEGKEREVGPW
jgi:hypothetical protein